MNAEEKLVFVRTFSSAPPVKVKRVFESRYGVSCDVREGYFGDKLVCDVLDSWESEYSTAHGDVDVRLRDFSIDLDGRKSADAGVWLRYSVYVDDYATVEYVSCRRDRSGNYVCDLRVKTDSKHFCDVSDTVVRDLSEFYGVPVKGVASCDLKPTNSKNPRDYEYVVDLRVVVSPKDNRGNAIPEGGAARVARIVAGAIEADYSLGAYEDDVDWALSKEIERVHAKGKNVDVSVSTSHIGGEVSWGCDSDGLTCYIDFSLPATISFDAESPADLADVLDDFLTGG